MAYRVEIRNNVTNETKIVTMDLAWFSHSVFWWTEGNFSCDCNREGVWGSDLEIDCGYTKYTVIKAIFDDGTEILLDGDV